MKKSGWSGWLTKHQKAAFQLLLTNLKWSFEESNWWRWQQHLCQAFSCGGTLICLQEGCVNGVRGGKSIHRQP